MARSIGSLVYDLPNSRQVGRTYYFCPLLLLRLGVVVVVDSLDRSKPPSSAGGQQCPSREERLHSRGVSRHVRAGEEANALLSVLILSSKKKTPCFSHVFFCLAIDRDGWRVKSDPFLAWSKHHSNDVRAMCHRWTGTRGDISVSV